MGKLEKKGRGRPLPSRGVSIAKKEKESKRILKTAGVHRIPRDLKKNWSDPAKEELRNKKQRGRRMKIETV